MFGRHLNRHYQIMRKLGLVRSQREFSRVWLGRGPHYLRNIGPRERDWRRLSGATTDRLRAHLAAVAAKVPARAANEINAILQEIERDVRIVTTMTGWSR